MTPMPPPMSRTVAPSTPSARIRSRSMRVVRSGPSRGSRRRSSFAFRRSKIEANSSQPQASIVGSVSQPSPDTRDRRGPLEDAPDPVRANGLQPDPPRIRSASQPSRRARQWRRRDVVAFAPCERSAPLARAHLPQRPPKVTRRGNPRYARRLVTRSLVSYAQNYEDVMLWRALKHVDHGFYIDVGAYSPVEYSVTKAFYERGWRGINIEPHPVSSAVPGRPDGGHQPECRPAIRRRPTMHFVQDTGLSTLDAGTARLEGWRRSRVVEAGPLTHLLHLGANVDPDQPVHFLKVDVEGSERRCSSGRLGCAPPVDRRRRGDRADDEGALPRGWEGILTGAAIRCICRRVESVLRCRGA